MKKTRSKLVWFILGLSTVIALGAYVTTTMFDSTYFSVSNSSVSLKGSLTNFFKLTTNSFQTAGSYQPASSTLTNLSNGIGTDLTNLNATAVANASSTNLVTHSGADTSGIVRLTSRTSVDKVTVGSGLSFDGTTLTATGMGPGGYTAEPVFIHSGDYTVTYTDANGLHIWNDTTNVTVTFNDGATNGFNLTFKNRGTGSLILTNAAGKTLDGYASVTVPSGVLTHWVADGANYQSGRITPRTFQGGNLVFATPADGTTNLYRGRALVTADFPSGVIADTNLASANLQSVSTGGGNAANWSASGTTNSSLAGLATVNGLTATQTVTAADMRFTGTTTSGLRLKSLTTAQKNALTSAAGDMVFDSDLGRFQAYDGAAWHSRVRLDGDTMTGLLAVPGLNYTAATALTFVATNTVIDLSAATQTFTCIMTANGTFGPSNIADGRNASLFVLNNQATNVTLTITGALGNYPTVVPAAYHAWIDMRGVLLNGSNNLHCAGSTYP